MNKHEQLITKWMANHGSVSISELLQAFNDAVLDYEEAYIKGDAAYTDFLRVSLTLNQCLKAARIIDDIGNSLTR